MKTLGKSIMILMIMLMSSGCEIAKIFGPFTLDAPTMCLIDHVCYKSSPESVGRPYWPGQFLSVSDNAFHFEYQRDLASSKDTAVLFISLREDVAFELGVEFPATGAIYLSDQEYEFTEGWVKFLDYRGNAVFGDTSYLSGAFEFTAHSKNGEILKVEEGTFDELPVKYQ